jgi:hypothetical protein
VRLNIKFPDLWEVTPCNFTKLHGVASRDKSSYSSSAAVQPPVGFGLLHHFIPRFSLFEEMCSVVHFNFSQSFCILSFHFFFGRPLDLFPMGFHSVIFLTVFVFSIQLRFPHHFVLCALMYLTVSSPLSSFSSSSLFLILLPSSGSTVPYILHTICLSNTISLHLPLITSKNVALPDITYRRTSTRLPEWCQFCAEGSSLNFIRNKRRNTRIT